MRRRRRTKYQWLPLQGRNGPTGLGDENDTYWDEFIVSVPTNGGVNSTIIDVTFDTPQDVRTVATTDPMDNFIRTGYILRRVVGNVYVHSIISNNGSVNPISGCAVTYGMFVARADEESEAGGAPQPIGATTQAQINANYCPQGVDNVREPWLFHRNWVLGAAARAGAAPGDGLAHFPTNNGAYGSAYDATFVDQKTIRKIEGDNRLWHIVSVRNLPINALHDGANQITVTVMLRLLGRPARTRQRGAF